MSNAWPKKKTLNTKITHFVNSALIFNSFFNLVCHKRLPQRQCKTIIILKSVFNFLHDIAFNYLQAFFLFNKSQFVKVNNKNKQNRNTILKQKMHKCRFNKVAKHL